VEELIRNNLVKYAHPHTGAPCTVNGAPSGFAVPNKASSAFLSSVTTGYEMVDMSAPDFDASLSGILGKYNDSEAEIQ